MRGAVHLFQVMLIARWQPSIASPDFVCKAPIRTESIAPPCGRRRLSGGRPPHTQRPPRTRCARLAPNQERKTLPSARGCHNAQLKPARNARMRVQAPKRRRCQAMIHTSHKRGRCSCLHPTTQLNLTYPVKQIAPTITKPARSAPSRRGAGRDRRGRHLRCAQQSLQAQEPDGTPAMRTPRRCAGSIGRRDPGGARA
jgi:hypothetical protein